MTEREHIAQRLRETPPSCIASLRVSPDQLPIEWDESCRSVWRLQCQCGCEHGRVLGYPLAEYKKDLPAGKNCFVGPIGFECRSCGTVGEVIDTDLHGYSAEVAKHEGGIGSAVIRGQGPRSTWQCPQCCAETFGLTVAFIFWDAVSDLGEDEPGWSLQDFFTVFLSFAKCIKCGFVSEPTEFGKL